MPQTVSIGPGRAQWTLSGSDVRPDPVRWRKATQEQREAYWTVLAHWSRLALQAQLLAGEDAEGKPLIPAKPISRKGYRDAGKEWRGPPMSPQLAASRFVSQIQTTAKPARRPSRVVGTWPLETRRIASWHARGLAGRGIPFFDADGKLAGWMGLKGQVTGIVRNVVGLNRKRLAWGVRKAVEEWTARYPLLEPAPALRPSRPAPARPGPTLTPRDRKRLAPGPSRAPAPAAPIETAEELLKRYPWTSKYRPQTVQTPATPPPLATPPTVQRPGVLRRAAGAIRSVFRRLFG